MNRLNMPTSGPLKTSCNSKVVAPSASTSEKARVPVMCQSGSPRARQCDVAARIS